MNRPFAAFVLLVLIIVAAAASAKAQVVVYGGWRRGVLDIPASDRPPHFAIFPPRPLFNNAVTYNPSYVAPVQAPEPLIIDNPYFKGPKPLYKLSR